MFICRGAPKGPAENLDCGRFENATTAPKKLITCVYGRAGGLERPWQDMPCHEAGRSPDPSILSELAGFNYQEIASGSGR